MRHPPLDAMSDSRQWMRPNGAMRIALAVCLLLAACSRNPDPPRGLPGLAFGDPPPAGLSPLAVPLPSTLAGTLAFFTRPGTIAVCCGLVLTDPVLAFFGGRFFSVTADLADAAEERRGRAALTRDFGAPYCRETSGSSVCLWRLGDVDAVLETAPGGATRFMLRYRPLADRVAAAADVGRGPAPDPGRGAAPAPRRGD